MYVSPASVQLEDKKDLIEVDLFLEAAKKCCELKLRNTKFAGMDKEDVVQEALIRVYESAPKYKKEIAKISTFVEKIVDSAIKDCLKKCSSKKNLMFQNAFRLEEKLDMNREPDEDDPEVYIPYTDYNYEMAEVLIDLEYHLNLSESEKRILRLVVEGYNFTEVAKILNINKSRVSHVWRKIRESYSI